MKYKIGDKVKIRKNSGALCGRDESISLRCFRCGLFKTKKAIISKIDCKNGKQHSVKLWCEEIGCKNGLWFLRDIERVYSWIEL